MEQKISLCELITILDNYNQTNDFVRVVSLGGACYNGEPYHGIWVEKANGTEELIKIPYFEKEPEEPVLTKEEAIKRHRMMWNWIAYETLKREEFVTKWEAIKHFGWVKSKMRSRCWCCTYAHKDGTCDKCPIQWPGGICTNSIGVEGLYEAWSYARWCSDHKKAADLAYQIANLPEREDMD